MDIPTIADGKRKVRKSKWHVYMYKYSRSIVVGG